jgi:hypothetical protein
MTDQTTSTQPSEKRDSAFNGKRIRLLRNGSIMGSRRGNQVIAQVNALSSLHIKMVDGDSPSITVADNGTDILIPRGQPQAGTTSAVGPTRMRVQSVSGDYLVCKSWDGSAEGASVNVAKTPELRHSVTSQVIEGVTVSFAYASRTNNLDGKRTATGSGYADQVEIVIPVYMDDDSSLCEIWADQPAGGTGVSVGGTPLIWMDTNRNGRAWCQV